MFDQVRVRNAWAVIPVAVVMAAGLALSVAGCVTMSDYSVTPHAYPGVRLYQVFCSSCHGLTGLGDGPIEPLIRGGVPDLTQIATRRGGAFPRAEVGEIIDGRMALLAHGTSQMPVWGFEFHESAGTDREERARVDAMISRLVDYLASIQRDQAHE